MTGLPQRGPQRSEPEPSELSPMNALVVFLSPLALLLPAASAEVAERDAATAEKGAETSGGAHGFDAPAAEPFEVLKEARRPPLLGQVRIEQRVIVRIAPSSRAAREQMMADVRPDSSAVSYREERLRGCVAISDIAGVQPAPAQNRLLLFMRDRRVLSAALERACNPREYYSGFYVERSEDGQICANRDLLQSRAGASCRVAELNRLVAIRD
jgi:hypothetical protein